MTLTRKNQGGDPLPLTYWWSLITSDARWFGSRHRYGAMLRSWWITLKGNNVERCNDCGRLYPTWMAADDVFARVKGNRHGQFCPACFDAKARALGIRFVWHPRIWIDNGVKDETLVAEIGAFQ